MTSHDLPLNDGQVWLAAMYVALVQLSGGVGSIVPENGPEYAVFIIGILIGSVIWAMVVGARSPVISHARSARLMTRSDPISR